MSFRIVMSLFGLIPYRLYSVKCYSDCTFGIVRSARSLISSALVSNMSVV